MPLHSLRLILVAAVAKLAGGERYGESDAEERGGRVR